MSLDDDERDIEVEGSEVLEQKSDSTKKSGKGLRARIVSLTSSFTRAAKSKSAKIGYVVAGGLPVGFLGLSLMTGVIGSNISLDYNNDALLRTIEYEFVLPSAPIEGECYYVDTEKEVAIHFNEASRGNFVEYFNFLGDVLNIPFFETKEIRHDLGTIPVMGSFSCALLDDSVEMQWDEARVHAVEEANRIILSSEAQNVKGALQTEDGYFSARTLDIS